MIEYDGYHRKMMFKVSCMQSKLGNIQNAMTYEENHRTNEKCENILVLSTSTLRNDALQSSKCTCTNVLMSRTRFRGQNAKIRWIVHDFYNLSKLLFDIFLDLWKKTEIALSARRSRTNQKAPQRGKGCSHLQRRACASQAHPLK